MHIQLTTERRKQREICPHNYRCIYISYVSLDIFSNTDLLLFRCIRILFALLHFSTATQTSPSVAYTYSHQARHLLQFIPQMHLLHDRRASLRLPGLSHCLYTILLRLQLFELSGLFPFDIYQNDIYISCRHTRYFLGILKVFRPDSLKLLLSLYFEPFDTVIVNILRDIGFQICF